MEKVDNLSQFTLAVLRNGCATYSLNMGDMSGRPFYAIALPKKHERTFRGVWGRKELADYIRLKAGLLADNGNALGGWVSDGVYYLDVVQLVHKSKGLEYAKALGRERQQIAIFDLETLTEITL